MSSRARRHPISVSKNRVTPRPRTSHPGAPLFLMHRPYPHRLTCLIRGDGQGDMGEKSFRAAAQHAQPFSVAQEPESARVMDNAHETPPAHPVLCLLPMAGEHTSERDLRIRQEPTQRLPVSDRLHVLARGIVGPARADSAVSGERYVGSTWDPCPTDPARRRKHKVTLF